MADHPRPAAGIRNELPLLIMDRDDNAAVHDAFAGVIPQPERIDCGVGKAAILGEIGVSIIKVLERERERWIDAFFWFLWCRFDVHGWRRNFSGR
jgi:hypothetical protein